MMKILLVNAHWDNRGDEAALCALADALFEMDDEAEITIIFKETRAIQEFPYEGRAAYAVTRFRPTEQEVKKAIETGRSDNPDMQKEIELVSDSDMVVYAPGGAVISDRFWWEKQLEYIFPIAYAQSRGKITVFASPSVGPFTTSHPFRDELFKRTDILCLRESLGMQAVIDAIGMMKNQILSCDLAFAGKVDWNAARLRYEHADELRSFLERYNRVVGMTVSDLSWNVGYLNRDELKENIENAFKGFIDYLSRHNIGIILIPQLFGEQNDEEYLKRYASKNVICLPVEGYNSNFQQYLISKLYAVVGIRYHCNIFAAKMRVPMIPIVYEQKMAGFLKDSGIEDWGAEVDGLSAEELIKRFSALEAEYEKRRAFLSAKLGDWKQKADQTIRALEKLRREQG